MLSKGVPDNAPLMQSSYTEIASVGHPCAQPCNVPRLLSTGGWTPRFFTLEGKFTINHFIFCIIYGEFACIYIIWKVSVYR